MKISSFALDDNSLAWLKEMAVQEERSKSQIVRMALREAAREAGLVNKEQPRMDDAKQQFKGD